MADNPFEGDPRITPVRPDLAPLHLRGIVEAGAYASEQPMRVSVPIAPISAKPDVESEQVSQMLFGEDFTAYEVENGWAWGQSVHDGYVGYIPEVDLMPEPKTTPTHRVAALQALIYPEPKVKSRPIGAVPFGSRMTVKGDAASDFVALDPGGYMAKTALKLINVPETLWVSTAERFIGTPYLWGGRGSSGMDCSGLVQTALNASGMDCPRDSDMQMALLGREVSPNTLKRGDLVFWKGHVGIMLSPVKILHANAHHMSVSAEAFETARSRIAKSEYGEILQVRRLKM